MVRIADQVVADWGMVIWQQDGQFFQQVQAYLLNGIILVVNPDEFFYVSEDAPW